MTDEIPQEDIIDIALVEIIDGLLGEEGDEDDFDATSEVVFEIIDYLVLEGVIEEIPEEVEESVKQAWLDKNMPLIKEALDRAINDGFQAEEPAL